MGCCYLCLMQKLTDGKITRRAWGLEFQQRDPERGMLHWATCLTLPLKEVKIKKTKMLFISYMLGIFSRATTQGSSAGAGTPSSNITPNGIIYMLNGRRD